MDVEKARGSGLFLILTFGKEGRAEQLPDVIWLKA
jgi:hypothetical protein